MSDKNHISGIIVLPHFESIWVWDGVLFIREGIYGGAIFKFRMTFPAEYPWAHPTVVFFSEVFHPLVGSQGDVDLSEFVNSNPKSKHNSFNILKFLKNIFLMNSYLKIETSLNPEAGRLFKSNYDRFKEEARTSVISSQQSKYLSTSDFMIKFSDFSSVHEKILNNLKERPEETLAEKVIGFWNWLVGAAEDLELDE